jgi:hypothetical protein
MKTEELRQFVDRIPFRPFSVRLSDGRHYDFLNLRDFGAPKSCRTLAYFGSNDFVLIDIENIVTAEVIERTKPEANPMIEQIRERLRRPQFKPFTLLLAEGRRLVVPDHSSIAVSSKVVVVIEKGISCPINPRHLVAVEEAEPI